VIPDEKCLNTKAVHVGKIDVDDLFKGVKITTIDPFAEDFAFNKENKENENNNLMNKSNINNYDYGSENKTEETNTGTSIFAQLDHKLTEYERQKWYIQTEITNFGPYSSEEIYLFLTNLFTKSPELKEDHTYMVIDSESDIYYKPDAVLDNLHDELKAYLKTDDPKKEIEKKFANKELLTKDKIHMKERR
jgi:hypothetical protein